jgi:hypothetical protein
VAQSAIDKKTEFKSCSMCGLPVSMDEITFFTIRGVNDFCVCEFCALGITMKFSERNPGVFKGRRGVKCVECGKDASDRAFAKPIWLRDKNEEVNFCLSCISNFLNFCLTKTIEKKVKALAEIENITRPSLLKSYANEWFGVFDEKKHSKKVKPNGNACPICGKNETRRITVNSAKNGDNAENTRVCETCFLVAQYAHGKINMLNSENADVACSLCGETNVSLVSVPGTKGEPIRLCENCLTTDDYAISGKKQKKTSKAANRDTVPSSIAAETKNENAEIAKTDEPDKPEDYITNFTMEKIEVDENLVEEDECWNFHMFVKQKSVVCSRIATREEKETYRNLLEASVCVFCVERRNSILTLVEREFRSCLSCLEQLGEKIRAKHPPLPKHLEHQPCHVCGKKHPAFTSAIVGPFPQNIVLCESCVEMLRSVFMITEKALDDENVEKISYRGHTVIHVRFPKRQNVSETKP